MAHDPDLEISDANCSREYPMTPCADVLLDEVVLNFISSKAPPFGRGFSLAGPNPCFKLISKVENYYIA